MHCHSRYILKKPHVTNIGCSVKRSKGRPRLSTVYTSIRRDLEGDHASLQLKGRFNRLRCLEGDHEALQLRYISMYSYFHLNSYISTKLHNFGFEQLHLFEVMKFLVHVGISRASEFCNLHTW